MRAALLAPFVGLATRLAPTAPASEYTLIQGEATLGEISHFSNIPEFEIRYAGMNPAGQYVSQLAFGTTDNLAAASEESIYETVAKPLAESLSSHAPYFDRFEILQWGQTIFQGPLRPGVIPVGWSSLESAGFIK